MARSLEWLFWISLVMVALMVVGYPALLALLAPFARRSPQHDEQEPTVALLIAAHNEERGIARRLENALALDYPKGKLEIIVAADGCTDRTCAIASSFAERGVVVHAFPRTGKTGVQNEIARMVKADILVFSDANAEYRPDAIRKLVRNFADPQVACVCGQLRYRASGRAAGECERKYWDYEKFMKRRESALSSLVGANGSIYAVRRADYVALERDLISDLVEPLALVRSGKRVVYEPAAISVEEASSSYEGEFRRKVRILTRSILALLAMRELLNPLHHGIFAVQLLMHKFLRYLMPLFLLLAFASLAALAVMGRHQQLFLMIVIGMAAGLLFGRAMDKRRPNAIVTACHLVYYCLMVNCALVVAWTNIARGRRITLWTPERQEA